LDWRIAGLGFEALAWADRARRLDPSTEISTWDPDPRRSGIMEGARALSVSDPSEWWGSEATVRDGRRLAVMVDAELIDAGRWAGLALTQGCPVCLVGTGGLSPATLRELASEAERRGLEARVLCGHRQVEDFAVASACVARGELGRLRSARFVRRGWIAAAPGSRTPSSPRAGLAAVSPVREAWRLFDQASGLGLVPMQTRFEQAGGAAWVALSRCTGGALLTIDVDDRARGVEPPRWTLEGDLGGYGRGCLRTTNPDGEVVEVPLDRTELDAVEPLREFTSRAQLIGDGPARDQQADWDRIARSVEIADGLKQTGY
jgi:hypothetical protein